jgi:GNAT superfamily N-acetyltransferase
MAFGLAACATTHANKDPTMAEQKLDPAACRIVPMGPGDVLTVGRIYRSEIPWAIFSIMGDRFTAQFIQWMSEQERTRVWVAKDAQDQIVGISCGTLDKPTIYRKIVREHVPTLIANVLLNIYRPAVMLWMLRAAWGRVRPPVELERSAPRPAAEWLFLTVLPAARGTGLAERFRQRMEADYREWGLKGPYVLLPLASNERAQAFHRKHGARLAARVRTRGHLIHEYHKELPPDDKPDHAAV